MAATDIRQMVPRVRRALEGAGAPEVLTDEAIKDIVADACADIMLYTGGLFGKTLTVTDRDLTTNAPTEYETSDELSLAEQSLLSAQAALSYFFFLFAGLKVRERIGDEANSWEYELSGALMRDQLKLLKQQRDDAIVAIAETSGAILDSYSSFVAIRDRETSRLVEPWVYDYGFGA